MVYVYQFSVLDGPIYKSFSLVCYSNSSKSNCFLRHPNGSIFRYSYSTYQSKMLGNSLSCLTPSTVFINIDRQLTDYFPFIITREDIKDGTFPLIYF